MKKVDIYTDGACSNNPGPGGYGAVLCYNAKQKELSGGCELTTNNRMELSAVINALEAIKEPCEVNLYSDSKYVVDSVSKGWVYKWKTNNWKRGKEKALNVDLWIKLLSLLEKHEVKFIWVKGHNQNPLNERCDELAREYILKGKLAPDEGYLQLENGIGKNC